LKARRATRRHDGGGGGAGGIDRCAGGNGEAGGKKSRAVAGEIDDGRAMLRKIFVDSKTISAGDFDLCWRTADLTAAPADVVEPFIQVLHEKGILLWRNR
jgi:hypothetical protein